MSDILIRGMEMPTEGGTIVVYKISGKFFAARAGRNKLFPLVPIPPHGDLIEREWMREAFYRYAKTGGVLYDLADKAPTIIPTEGE